MRETFDRIWSDHLQNDRTIWVREPVGPTAGTLTVFLDGELYRGRVQAGSVVESLHGTIASSWFVFVSMESIEARWRECPCHPPFAHFVADELLPWLESRHPTMKSVRQRVLVGLSYTGLAAVFVAKTCPGVFQKVISQSGSFWWHNCWLVGQISGPGLRLPTDFYLDVGTREVQENVRHREDVLQVVSQVDGVRRMRDALLQSGYHVTYTEFDGGHEFRGWKETLPGALRWALPPGTPG